jgi:hypothetical protein
MIAAVLLIPEAGDPLGLLADGVCGARPPVLVKAPHGWTSEANYRRYLAHGHNSTPLSTGPISVPRALVLAWDGEPVAEGIDRLLRVVQAHAIGSTWPILPDDPAGMALGMEVAGHGARVLLDSSRREVAP